MNRYRKAWVAALGALAQIAVVLDQALDDGTLPASWVPWVRVTLAILTAVGVYAVRNDPAPAQTVMNVSGYDAKHLQRAFDDQLRHRRDTGSARTVLVTLVGFAIAALLVVATMLAGPAEARPRPVEHVGVTFARTCSGVLEVGFGLEVLHGRAWTWRQDDGTAVVELHHLGSAAGPGGHWEAYPARSGSGGEGRLRVDVVGLPYWDAVRIVHGGVASSQRVPEDRCPA